jgi:hypothetical protein
MHANLSGLIVLALLLLALAGAVALRIRGRHGVRCSCSGWPHSTGCPRCRRYHG